MFKQENEKRKIVKFLFPFYPIKIFKSTKLMMLIAVLLSLKIFLTFISIPITAFGFNISIAWIPVMIMGWYFGPVLGLFLGALSDTLGYLIFSHGIWFWMYAIQEPIVCIIAGLLSGVCVLRKNKQNINIIYDLIFNQIIYIFFSILSIVILMVWLNPNQKFANKDPNADLFYSIYKWVAISLLLIFTGIIEFFIFYNLKQRKKNQYRVILFMYSATVVIIVMLIFSFLLGPITTINYFYYLNGHYSENFLKYGTIFYLVPRIAVESVKVPIECIILCSVILAVQPNVNNLIQNLYNKWENN